MEDWQKEYLRQQDELIRITKMNNNIMRAGLFVYIFLWTMSMLIESI